MVAAAREEGGLKSMAPNEVGFTLCGMTVQDERLFGQSDAEILNVRRTKIES